MEGLSRRRFVPDMLIRSTYKLTSTSLPWTAGSLAHLQRVAVDRQTYNWLHVCICWHAGSTVDIAAEICKSACNVYLLQTRKTIGACFVPAVCPERTGNSPSSPQDMHACRLSISKTFDIKSTMLNTYSRLGCTCPCRSTASPDYLYMARIGKWCCFAA